MLDAALQADGKVGLKLNLERSKLRGCTQTNACIA